MKVLVVADGHYYITPEGEVYADSVYDYNFYQRYLMTFDHVYAVIRATPISKAPSNKKKTSGNGISFLLLPQYQGPYQYLKKYVSIVKNVKKICSREDVECAIFRIPAATSNIVCKYFEKTHKPFGVEVVVDPWENFSPRASGNKIMLWIVRRSWTKFVKDMCLKAVGASYVTKSYLQEHYPPRVSVENCSCCFTENYSSVELADDLFAIPRNWTGEEKEFVISHVSNSFTGYEKGHLTLMDAIKKVNNKGYNVKVVFVGDGPLRKEFEEYAKRNGIDDKVTFTGRLANGNEVRKVIRNSDIFILPTLAEGLPRALLEAMAEGIPCLSSPTCGIPEVLEEEFLYDFADSEGFAKGIINFITHPERMKIASENNLNMAKKFSASILNSRRKQFYDKLKEYTENVSCKKYND